MEKTESLVLKAQRGSKEAFVALIEREKLSMSRVALSILHREEDAADAVSETVLTALEKLHTLRSPKYFKTWLTRVLIHHSCRILREREQSLSLDEVPDWYATGPVSGNDELLDLKENLALIAENDRLMLILYYLDGFSVREIASLLHLKESAVKVRLHRSRNRIRKVYQEQEGKLCEASGK